MSFIKKTLTSNTGVSSKRFVTIIIAAHFIIASFTVLIMLAFLLFYPRTVANIETFKVILHTLETILEYDFYIILSGFGFIAVENVGQAVVEKAKVGFGNITRTVNNEPDDIADNIRIDKNFD